VRNRASQCRPPKARLSRLSEQHTIWVVLKTKGRDLILEFQVTCIDGSMDVIAIMEWPSRFDWTLEAFLLLLSFSFLYFRNFIQISAWP
jgi:hypothetical protein